MSEVIDISDNGDAELESTASSVSNAKRSNLDIITFPVYLVLYACMIALQIVLVFGIILFPVGAFVYLSSRGWYAEGFEHDLGEYIAEVGSLPILLQIADQLHELHTQQNDTAATDDMISTNCSTVIYKGEEYQVPGNCESYLIDIYFFICWFWFIVFPFFVLFVLLVSGSVCCAASEDSKDEDDEENEKQDSEDDEADAVLEELEEAEMNSVEHYYQSSIILDAKKDSGESCNDLDEAGNDSDKLSTIERVGNLLAASFLLGALALAISLCILVPNSQWALRTAVAVFYIPWYLFSLALLLVTFCVFLYIGFILSIFGLYIVYFAVCILAILLGCFGLKLDVPDLDIEKIYEHVFEMTMIAWKKLKSFFCNTVSVEDTVPSKKDLDREN